MSLRLVQDHTCAAAGWAAALANTFTYRLRLHVLLRETPQAARPARRDGLAGNVPAASGAHGSSAGAIVLYTQCWLCSTRSVVIAIVSSVLVDTAIGLHTPPKLHTEQ